MKKKYNQYLLLYKESDIFGELALIYNSSIANKNSF